MRNKSKIKSVCFAVASSILSATTAIAQQENDRKRYAVVIGNQDYVSLPDLDNPHADAKIMADILDDAGFLVFEEYDVTRTGFEILMKQVSQDIDVGSEVIFYFAGHGFQIGPSNFLVPTDAEITTKYDVPFQTVALDSWIDIIAAKADVQVFVLDSCRENPFAGTEVAEGAFSQRENIGNGFAFQSAPINSLISYSTSPGAVAYDGSGENSPFTKALVDTVREMPDAEIVNIFSAVRRSVFEETTGLQVPWESSSLIAPLYPFRGQSKSSSPQIAVTSGAKLPESLEVSSGWKKQIELGNDLSELASLDATFVLKNTPNYGALFFSDQVRGHQSVATSLLKAGDTLSADVLKNLQYHPFLSRSKDLDATAERSDSIVLASGDNLVTVNLSMPVDACDTEAGGVLDAQGVGIEVLPEDIDPDTALQACLDAVERSPDEARFHYQLGRAYWANSAYEKAEAAFRHSLEMGHIRSNTALGTMELQRSNRTGGFLEPVANEAVHALYDEGVRLGDPLAWYSKGRQLLRHSETPRSKAIGYDLLLKAFDAGYIQALNEVGFHHLTEDTLGYDPERAIKYFEEAAARGSAFGHNNLGLVYSKGWGGIPKDYTRAISHFEAASDKGHSVAATHLGRIYDGAENFAPQYAKAVEWYDLGLSRGDPWGGANGAWIILNKRSAGLTPVDAAVRAGKASALGNPDAAKQASKLLAGLDMSTLDAAAQTLLVEMGHLSPPVDGVFGENSRRALIDAIAPYPDLSVAQDPAQRLTNVAKAYFKKARFRIDTF